MFTADEIVYFSDKVDVVGCFVGNAGRRQLSKLSWKRNLIAIKRWFVIDKIKYVKLFTNTC